ncbi:transferase hexapeptide (six repeat-containing protein) [Candidatus Electrothrix marina]|uniref:Transferase hexapeptide (Six repeat-containing protein) n=1 Tax=Candidatus Electrothrix marina TaxID=1859130 RepID=A0A444JAE2_9BACT|nr:transferase hexapeptide (six repeat-containing protein) [Candidatus Electrothrix marina]
MKTAEEDRTELQPTVLEKKMGREGSAFSKYRRAVVGNNGLFYLFTYEVVGFFILPLPGKAGSWLRRFLLPCIIGKTGKRISIEANCTLRNGSEISIGTSACIEKNVTLDVKPGADGLSIGDRVHLGRMTVFNCNGGGIEIGDDSKIGNFCRFGSLRGLMIGKHCRIGNRCCFSGASHAFARLDIPIMQQPLTCKGAIVVGDHVTIGEEVTILDGVTIGNNVTILDGSLVNKNIADGRTAAGVPARPLDVENAEDTGIA